MPIRVLREDDARRRELAATVCVIGAGIAGLLAATQLARATRARVVVLESGLRDVSAAEASQDVLQHPLHPYEGRARARIYGGTSTLWAGKLLPLSDSDMAARPYLGLEAWPLDRAELDRHRPGIERLMGVDALPYEAGPPALDPHGLLPSHDATFVCRWPKRPTARNHHIAHALRDDIASLDNLEIWLGATVVGFTVDPATLRLAAIEAVDDTGRTLAVRADEFVIAAGTLDSTRLLLLADRQSNGCLSSRCDALGRYFNDHVGLEIARLRPLDATRTNAALSDRSPFGSLRHLHFELRPEVQQQLALASAYFDIAATLPDQSSLNKTKQLARVLSGRGTRFNGADAATLLRDLPSLWKTGWWQFARRQKYWPDNAALWIKVWAEQLPERRNRVVLSDTPGPLNVPLIRLEWRPAEVEERLFRTMIEAARGFWQRSFAGFCALDWQPDLAGAGGDLLSRTTDLSHPAGSLRMGTRQADSVVDTQLRVHLLQNVSVASAAVFPSSGSANPTLTIMELAMHAARHIARRVNRGD